MNSFTSQIDLVFAALSDSTRRDILDRSMASSLTVNQIAAEYDMSVAAVSKHLRVLNQAGLISKRKDGRFVHVRAQPEALLEVVEYLNQYKQLFRDEIV